MRGALAWSMLVLACALPGMRARAQDPEPPVQPAEEPADASSAEPEAQPSAPEAQPQQPGNDAAEPAPEGSEEQEPSEDPGPASDPEAEDEAAEAEAEEPLPEGHEPTLTYELSTGDDGVRTGDLVRLVITAEVPEGDDVAVPDQELGTFEIFDRRYASEAVDGGRRRRFRFELDLLALEPGDQELPAIRLRVVTADGEVGTVRTEARTVEVGSHIANEPDAQPRPPTQPVRVFEEDYTLLWVLGVLAALLVTALISFFVARWWSRRPKEAKPPPPPRPPWEVALEKLRAIDRDKAALLAESKEVELVDRVSDVLREYLGQRYDFNGLESTTDEVVTRLAKVKLRGVKLADITALLADSDLVKFAKARPDEAQCARMLAGAVEIVRATTPRPSAVPSARPASGAASARIVTKDGEVVLPIVAHTLEEAEREIRAAVGAAFRDNASDPSFEGTLRVGLGPALRTSQLVTDSLRRLHTRLSSELATVPLPSGRRARIVIEHFHESLRVAAERGKAAKLTVIDDDGVRVEERVPAGAAGTSTGEGTSASTGTGTSTSTSAVDPQDRESPPSPASRERAGVRVPGRHELHDASTGTGTGAGTSTSTGTGTGMGASTSTSTSAGTGASTSTSTSAGTGTSTGTGTSESTGASESARTDAGAPAPRERIKTGPVDWDRPPRQEETKPSGERIKTGPVDWDRSAVAREPAATIDARSLERVLPSFATGESPSGVLLRWVTGLERPVRYLAGDGTPIEASALAGLGLTRGGLHERALGNLRRAVPPGFAPGDEPAVIDDEGAAILALPELVPATETWIAYPMPGEGLVVMLEGAPSTRAELARLERESASSGARLFDKPVRVSRRGFEPLDWPGAGRSTDPGFASPGGDRGGDE